jgi:hypothetical protein
MKRKMLDICLQIAKSNLHKHAEPYRHFSFVIVDNRVVEWGTNRRGSPLTHLGYDRYTKLHSEIDAYFKARGLIGNQCSFEIVNIRLTKGGIIRNSKPCRCCFEFLKGLKCKRIWFSTDLENFARMDVY